MAAVPEKDYLKCPYDPLHKIRKSRMPIHLRKCAKQHPHIKLLRCSNNSTHLYKESMAQEHLDTCPDRQNMSEVRTEHAEHKLPAGLLPIPAEPISVDQSTSYWDDEITTGNTLKSIRESAQEMKVYLTHNLTGSKAEKNQRKKKERVRYSQTKNVISTSELPKASTKMENVTKDIAQKSAEQTMEGSSKDVEEISADLERQTINPQHARPPSAHPSRNQCLVARNKKK